MTDPRIHDAYALIKAGNSDQATSLLKQVTESPSGVQDGSAVVVAHFLLGFLASKIYWQAEKSVTGTQPGSLRPYPSEVQDQVIRHLTAFLEHPYRDRCLVGDDYGLRLNVGNSGEYEERGRHWSCPAEREMWNLYHARWAAFPDFGKATVSKRDDLSLALDRRALAFHLCNRPLKAASDLQAVLERSDWTLERVERLRIVDEYYPDSFGTPQNANLQGWIGWLLFDGGEYAEAANYLAACHRFMQPDDKLADEEGISKEYAKLITWFDFIYGGYHNMDYTHALWEIGEYDGYGFEPTQSLLSGADGFLFRLALSLFLAGRESESIAHLQACVTISPSWSDPKTMLELVMTDPAKAKRTADVILEKFRSDLALSRK